MSTEKNAHQLEQALLATLSHVRRAMVAARHDAPVLPALLCAEEQALRALFSEQEVEHYLTSDAAKVYGR